MKKTILLGVVAFALFNEWSKRRRVPIYFVEQLPLGYNAMTIPPFGIFIASRHRENAALAAHKCTHWEQYRVRGLVRFYADYLHELVTYGYDHMPMEIAARHGESHYCKTNYTQCVRQGIAKTIHNPHFRK